MREFRDTLRAAMRAPILVYDPVAATMFRSSQMLIGKATMLMNQLTDEIAETEALRSELSN